MHDTNVRRRRAVLALLVVLSVVLISASFGSSGTGPLHAIQSGFLDVMSPIESGAGKALTPVHDLFSAIDDVFNASSQRDKLQKQFDTLQAEFVKLQATERENSDLASLLHLNRRDNLSGDGPVAANVTIRGSSLFVNEVGIDIGSGAGVRMGDPVVSDQGLVGTITAVAGGASVVTLIDDSTANEAAVDNANGAVGVVSADPGNPNLLQLSNVEHPSVLKVGDFVVTAGSAPTHGASMIPPNIPIGTILSTPPAGNDLASATVAPTVDFGALGTLEVLTRVPA